MNKWIQDMEETKNYWKECKKAKMKKKRLWKEKRKK